MRIWFQNTQLYIKHWVSYPYVLSCLFFMGLLPYYTMHKARMETKPICTDVHAVSFFLPLTLDVFPKAHFIVLVNIFPRIVVF